MSSILFTIPELFQSYKAWVSKNPSSLGDWESSVKWISYFLAGRINNSHIISELIYCLSNLLVMFNDGIIKKKNRDGEAEKIKVWLTILEYSEVFCELSASKIWGPTGKWMIIVLMQAFKCIARFLLIIRYKEEIIQNPPVPVLNRKNVDGNFGSEKMYKNDFDSVCFTLKRSGKMVRKIDAAPPFALRDWKPLPKTSLATKTSATRNLLAETIYIAKPVVHLAMTACFGHNTWQPWMAALLMDLMSLELYRSTTKNAPTKDALTPQQRLQISKRTILLVLYMLRSPVYEKFTKNKLNSFFSNLSRVPLVGLVFTHLAQYIPFWQGTYFYMWST